jgi:hypothetical protein
MLRRLVQRIVVCLGVLASLPSVLMAQLQSVDEALAVSKRTGRPIFAMAGNKT